MKVLLVEDDRRQLMPLQTVLCQAGHTVDGVSDGETAQWLLSERDYDLLILDWMLPHVSGVQLCEHYRASGKTAPVLMITAKDTTLDKVTGSCLFPVRSVTSEEKPLIDIVVEASKQWGAHEPS